MTKVTYRRRKSLRGGSVSELEFIMVTAGCIGAGRQVSMVLE